jgi:FkbM family methyltransferase
MPMKNLVKRVLGAVGLRVVRTDRTFGLNPLVDIAMYYPERPVATVVDAGANVGRFTAAAVRRYPDATVHAFEPVARTFRELRANVGRHRNVRLHHAALGGQEGEGVVVLQAHSEWNSLAPAVNTPRAGAASEVVRVLTLDRLAVEGHFRRIDLLKTDTEGYDLEVLVGAAGLLAAGAVGFVLAEAAFDRADRGHTNFFDLYDRLAGYGLRLFALYDQTVDPGERHAGYCNALFVNPRPGPAG